ncbi:MAG: hypothetical protein PHX81_10065, partial [Eubacteriales bacterium]|nr:hypothetical protein [Eubacteriales bacterium]
MCIFNKIRPATLTATDTKQLLGVGAARAADNKHHVGLPGDFAGLTLPVFSRNTYCIKYLQFCNFFLENHANFLVFCERKGRLGDQNPKIARKITGFGLSRAADDHTFAAALPVDPHDFGVPRGSRNDDPLFFAPGFAHDQVDLGHEGAGAVDHLAALIPKFAECGWGDAMRPDQDRRAVFDRLGVGGDPHALAFEL